MEPSERIEELEAKVRALNAQVERLLGERQDSEPEAAAEERGTSKPGPGGTSPALVENVRRKMDEALRSDPSDSIESRIGAIWLSRLAVVVTMTTIALAARTTFSTEALGPVQKVCIAYAVALGFSIYGLFFRRQSDLFAQAILGCGLAGLYFATYAALFVDEMQVLDPMAFGLSQARSDLLLFLLGLPLLLACMGLMVVVAHRRKSPTVAGIGAFLAYYTVALSCYRDPHTVNLLHALLTCTALALVTLVFHALHRWLLFSWAALIATHLTYLYVFLFLNDPAGTSIPANTYFWLSNGFLTVCYVLFSFTCILDARKTGEYRRGVAPMSGVNSAVYLTLSWFAIRGHYPEYEWMFRSGIAVMLLVLALFASATGPRRNYLFQIFIAKTVIMITLALQAYFSGEKLLVAMALECLALGFSYKRSALVVFKVLGLCLMAIVFVACLANVKMPGMVPLGSYEVPANWFSAVGVAFVFQVVAWFYEHFVRRLAPEERTVQGQWFMADSFLDLRSASLAIGHAAAGAFILLTITIFDLGEHVSLPYLLAAEGLALAILGLALRTPQIEVASVLLFAAAHLCYHVFLWMPPTAIRGFESQPNYVIYTLALSLLTFGGAHAWERYLKRYLHPEAAWEHHLAAAAPYLAATFMLTTLLARCLEPLHVPAAQGALGMSLLLVGSLTRYPGVKASGLLAMSLGIATWYIGLYDIEAPLHEEPSFLLYGGLFLATCVGSERLFVILQRFEKEPSKAEDVLRTVLVGAAVVLGMLGLHEWCREGVLIFYLLGLAVIAISLGAVFRESRYRWGGLFLIAVLLVRAFLRLSDSTSELYQILTFGAPAVVLLIVSWAYSYGRHKKGGKPETGQKP